MRLIVCPIATPSEEMLKPRAFRKRRLLLDLSDPVTRAMLRLPVGEEEEEGGAQAAAVDQLLISAASLYASAYSIPMSQTEAAQPSKSSASF
jgi:hypothetical protein